MNKWYLYSIKQSNLLAIHEFVSHLSQTIVMLLSDNTTTVSYLSKQGWTHSALLCSLAWQIFQLAKSLSLEMSATSQGDRTSSWMHCYDTLLSMFQVMAAQFGLSLVIELLPSECQAASVPLSISRSSGLLAVMCSLVIMGTNKSTRYDYWSKCKFISHKGFHNTITCNCFK